MSEVEHVGVWIGLIVGIASAVLAGVAIWFTVRVNTRTETLNNEMVRTVESIRLQVQSVRDDVSGLIRNAWERMLPGPAGDTHATDSSEPTSVIPRNKDDEPEERGTQRGAFSRMINLVDGLSTEAQELARVLMRQMHLTPEQFNQLRQLPELHIAVKELLDNGLLRRLKHTPHEGEDPVDAYWFPGRLVGLLRDALTLFPRAPETVRALVRNGLKTVGYPGDSRIGGRAGPEEGKV